MKMRMTRRRRGEVGDEDDYGTAMGSLSPSITTAHIHMHMLYTPVCM